MSKESIKSLLQSGIELFCEFVGFQRGELADSFQKIQISRDLEDIDAAIEWDPSAITSILLLRHFAENAVSQISFNAVDIIRQPEILEKLNLPRRLLQSLDHPIISGAANAFQMLLSKALAVYGADEREDIIATLSNRARLAVLRRDALKSIATLRIDQFLDGDSDNDTTPIYAKYIHQWWNINSLIEGVTGLPQGVSLNLIREPDAYSTYFAFAIRNGGKIFIMSDISDMANPLQSQKTRRPDRSMSDRMSKHWFPYELLNLKFSEENNSMYIDRASTCTHLAVRQSETIPLKPVAELEPDCLIWLVMMFDLIIDKFWTQGFKSPELSYTGEMIKTESSLLQVAINSKLPVPSYKAIGLTELSIDAVNSDAPAILKGLGVTAKNINRWMIDRYGKDVTDESINLVAEPSGVYLSENNYLKVYSGNEISRMGFYDQRDIHNSENRLQPLPATTFGTKEELDNNRIWLARYNLAVQIQLKAEAEFKARSAELKQWYVSKVEENLPNLLKLIGNEYLFRIISGEGTFSSLAGNLGCSQSKEGDFCKIPFMSMVEKGYFIGSTFPCGFREPICVVTGAKASFFVIFQPAFADDIAFLTGCNKEELPDVLQHYDMRLPYHGNSILKRIDPALSKLRNPWSEMEFKIRIGISKKGLKALKALTEMPPKPYIKNGQDYDKELAVAEVA